MKLTFITLLTFGLFACNSSADRRLVDNATVKDHPVPVDKNEINNDEYNCGFDIFVKDPEIPEIAKDIYLDHEWNLNNDNEALALLDGLTAKDISLRPFYFKVVTKSVKKSDGYFSEGLGNAGYNYVLNNTEEFASFFDSRQCHTESDLETWADIVMLELGIISEDDYDKPIVEHYIKKLQSNCNNCSATQKETINKFSLALSERWKGFLQHTDTQANKKAELLTRTETAAF